MGPGLHARWFGSPVGAAAAAFVVLACLAGCGGGGGAVVARVGGAPIAEPTVEHWARVIGKGGSAGGVAERVPGRPRRQALAFLIAMRWLRDEAAALGAPVSAPAVEQALAARGATGELADSLHAAGEAPADLRLEVEGELASAAIRTWLAARSEDLPPAQIAAYYRANRRRFATPETRIVDLIENLPSRAAARALVARIGTSRAFARRGYHEVLQRGTVGTVGVPGKAALVRAIFTARTGVLVGPMPLNSAWTMFVVRQIVPGEIKPLGEVRAAVARRLAASRLSELSRAFAQAYRRRWRARTSCSAGQVVPGCAQYRGDPSAELGWLSSGA